MGDRRPPAGRAGRRRAGDGPLAADTAWAFGQRLRAAGLLGSMGWVGSAFDNAMMESFFGTLPHELLDCQAWRTRRELASAIFEWIEGWYNPRRRHASVDHRSPADYERLYATAEDAALS